MWVQSVSFSCYTDIVSILIVIFICVHWTFNGMCLIVNMLQKWHVFYMYIFIPPDNCLWVYCFHICLSVMFCFLLLILINNLSGGSHYLSWGIEYALLIDTSCFKCIQMDFWYFNVLYQQFSVKQWQGHIFRKMPFSTKKWWYFFLILHKKIGCGYSLEVPLWGTSNEYPQPMFCGEIKKKYYVDTPLIWSCDKVTRRKAFAREQNSKHLNSNLRLLHKDQEVCIKPQATNTPNWIWKLRYFKFLQIFFVLIALITKLADNAQEPTHFVASFPL